MIIFNKSINFIKGVAKKKIAHIAVFLVLTVLSSIVLLGSVKTVKVYDGDYVASVMTSAGDIDGVLANANIFLGEFDKAEYDKNGNIVIVRNFPVNVVIGNDEETIYISGGTVGDLLEDKGLEIGEHDKINYSLDHKLSSGMTVEITNIEYVYSKRTETVPYNTRIVYSATMKQGATRSEGGVNGEKNVTYLQKIVNGEVVEEELVSETYTKYPVIKTIYIGTKASPSGITVDSDKWISFLRPEEEIKLDKNGRPVEYKKLLTGIASAYSPDDGRWSATGVVLKAGYVAVNPEVIPYGSKLYIKTADGSIIYGYAIAADTGGFVHMYPDRIVDLFFESELEAKRFGLKNIEIFILE